MSNTINENQNKKPKLGRGLGSLLGGQSSVINDSPMTSNQVSTTETTPINSVPADLRVWKISIDKINTSEQQPRTHFEKKALEELAESIKEKGVIQPIVVRKNKSNGFEIIAGERRWRAAQMAGLHEIPAILKNFDDRETLEVAIIENVQRENLNPIEEAEAYQKLIEVFHHTQEQVAKKVGKERATIANSLRLLQLPKEVIEMVKNKEISMGHAKVLLGCHDHTLLLKLAKKVVKEALSVRKLEAEIHKALATSQTVQKNTKSNIESSVQKIQEDLQKALGTKVQIDYNSGKGKISIHFYSNDELTEINERIMSGCMN